MIPDAVNLKNQTNHRKTTNSLVSFHSHYKFFNCFPHESRNLVFSNNSESLYIQYFNSNVSDAMPWIQYKHYTSDPEGVTVEVEWLVLAIKWVDENTLPSSECSFNVDMEWQR